MFQADLAVESKPESARDIAVAGGVSGRMRVREDVDTASFVRVRRGEV
jgi:hypothetical protein